MCVWVYTYVYIFNYELNIKNLNCEVKKKGTKIINSNIF